MKGTFTFKVDYRNLTFNFKIIRNITILQGDSATGKTTLINLLAQSLLPKKRHGISVITNAKYYVYTESSDRSWKETLENKKEMVIFFEENNTFIHTHEFARYVADSGNYFVFITRDPIKDLPYSTKEIYSIGCHYNGFKHVYEFNEVYKNFPYLDNNFDLIITEDSKSRFQFFSKFFCNSKVESANGASKFITYLDTLSNSDAHNILCIADGAAFGCYIRDLVEFSMDNLDKRITIWLPESFEWVLLKARVISFDSLTQILNNPSEYIECRDYVSWERFFTYLVEKYSDEEWKYTKGELDPYYYSEKNKEKIKGTLPKELQNINNTTKDSETKKMSLF